MSDYSFGVDYGFTIYFDVSLYSDLGDPPPYVNDDWDIIVLQPDTSLPDDGVYDALAWVNDASLADIFTVSFVWLGSGIPDSQYYEVYDDSWNIVESDETAPVPEPATIILLGIGLFGLYGLRKRMNV